MVLAADLNIIDVVKSSSRSERHALDTAKKNPHHHHHHHLHPHHHQN